MNHEQFEELWRKRQQLSRQQVQELERLARKDRQLRSFVEGGDWVRDLCLRTGDDPAPRDFSYRMAVYAKNHLDDDQPLPAKGYSAAGSSWLAWPAVSAGIATGALAVLLAFGGFGGDEATRTANMAGSQPGPVEQRDPAPFRSAVEELGGSASFAQQRDSTSASRDTLTRQTQDRPDWRLERVSTGQ